MKSFAICIVLVGGLWCTQHAALQAQPYAWTTVAGQIGNCGNVDGVGTNALFCDPWNVTADKQGTLYVAESQHIRRIQRLGNDWVVSTLNLTNASGYHIGYFGLYADDFGNLFVSSREVTSFLGKITPFPTNWVLTMVAPDCRYPFTNGLDCWTPVAIVLDKIGNLYVTASDGTVRKLCPVGDGWDVSIIAGTPLNLGSADGTNGQASFFALEGIALDNGGNLYVSDYQENVIRKLTPVGTNWVVTTIAGMPGAPVDLVDGTNSFARFANPVGMAVDSRTNIYVMDNQSSSLRMVSPVGGDWIVTTITPDNPRFAMPLGVAVDEADNVYVADTINHTIRVGMVATRLQATRAGDKVVYSWPASANNFVLETSSTPDSVGEWIPLTNGILTWGKYLVVTNALSKHSEFVRLRLSQ